MSKAHGPLYRVALRRRREGITDYTKRLALLRSAKTRLVVRKTNKYIVAQLVNYAPTGDKTVVGVSSKDLKEFGFDGKCNTPSAYLTGALLAKKGAAKGVKEAIADFGRHAASKGSLLYAVLQGAFDAGLKIPFSQEKMPSADRLEGKHLKGESAKKFAEAKKKIVGG
jgi:large subunit ribosomal protein L18